MSELSEKIPQFSKITIQRTVRKLRDEQRIEMIGKGKKYKIYFEVIIENHFN